VSQEPEGAALGAAGAAGARGASRGGAGGGLTRWLTCRVRHAAGNFYFRRRYYALCHRSG
jgi:hypothetical protein